MQNSGQHQARTLMADASFHAVFDGLGDALFFFDADTRFTDVNLAACQLLGYSREELLSLRIADVVARSDGWTEREFADFIHSGSWRGEPELRRKDGSVVPVEARAATVSTPAGSVYLSVARDISERKRAEARLHEESRELADALDRAQIALAVRDQFLTVASHELRTPLTAMKGQIQLARRRLQRDPSGSAEAAEQALAVAEAQANRLTRLVGEVLDISQMAAGRFSIRRAPLRLGRLLRQIVADQRLPEPARSVELSLPDEDPAVDADAARLGQALAGLLQNGRRYSSTDIPIHVSLTADAESATITMVDAGGGAAEQELARVLQLFQRGESAEASITGLGLGPYIAHQIITAHGGSLLIHSSSGAGSGFTVVLPRIC